jgi:hypothetical protein
MGHLMATKIIIFETQNEAQAFCDAISERLLNILILQGVEVNAQGIIPVVSGIKKPDLARPLVFDVPKLTPEDKWWVWSPRVDYSKHYEQLTGGLGFVEVDYPDAWREEE